MHLLYYRLYVYRPVRGVLHLSSFSALPVFSFGSNWTVRCSIVTYYINGVRYSIEMSVCI